MNLKLRRLWIQLTSDKKRFGLLLAVVAVGLLLWTRIIVVSNLPRTAIAEDREAAKAKSTVKVPSSTTGITRATIEIDAPPVVTRDPFVISPDYFPKPTALVEMHQEAGKSAVSTAEDAEQLKARRTTQLRALVERFKLEAAMAKGEMAVISGKTYRQGDVVDGDGSESVKFSLAEVRHRSVILECEDRRFELKMATP
jgi:hypothetical protein